MMSLLPDFGSLALTLGSFVVALLVIVAIHEYGHYIVGRWCGIHAQTFSLGFGPVLAKRTDKRGTVWQIAALPFGGYVKFLGDANAASVGAAPVDPAEARRTMAGAPVWARAATVAAGPVANFLLAIVIFAGMAMVGGKPTKDLVIGDMDALPAQWVNDLRPGDRVVSLGGVPTPDLVAFVTAISDLPLDVQIPYGIERGGQAMVVQGPYPRPAIVQSVAPRSAAYEAGIKRGDVIMSVNGVATHAFATLNQIVKTGNGAAMDVRVWRAGDVIPMQITPRRTDLPKPGGGFETRWLMGITAGTFFAPQTESVGVIEAVQAAARQVWYVLTSSLSGLWHMITGAISSCNLSSPVGIAETSGAMASQGAQSFIAFVAFLSVAVGLLNLFPVPILDGGHLVFHAVEAVTGRPPSERFLTMAMSFGAAVLGTFMIFALLNDVWLCP